MVDFIVKLLESNGCAATAGLYLQYIWKHHMTLNEIIYDRGSVFTSKFIKRPCEPLQIQPTPTTAFHPQSDNQIEKVNQMLEQFLCMFTTIR